MLQPDYSTVLYAVVAIFLGSCYFFLQRRRPGKAGKLPPCPVRPWPLVGNMFSIGEDMREQLMVWHKQCGDLYSLYYGSTLVIVVNGWTTIKEVFVRQSAASSDRPKVFFNEAAGMGEAGAAFSSGVTWKENRAAVLKILREFGMGKNLLADKIQDEANCFVDQLVETKEEPIYLGHLTRVTVSNVISSIIFGRRFGYEDPRFKKVVDGMVQVLECAKGAGAINFFPFLKYLPGDMFDGKKIQAGWGKLANMIVEEIEDMEKMDGECQKVERTAENFINSYKRRQDNQEQSGKETTLNRLHMIKNCVDLFAAGTDTLSNTIVWCILYMLHSPDVQTKIHAELDREVGQGRQPTVEDQARLPYLGAVIKETQRLANVVPHSILRKTSEEITVGEYVIPQGTTLIPNLDSVLHDPEIWGSDVMEFNPERFLDKDGALIHREELIPFSIGPRICLGEAMAKMELFLFLANLFQRFEFQAPDPQNLPTLKATVGLTAEATPFKVRCVDRFMSTN
ncbi:hypothetical protein EGW08_012696 [Elysia chlorotica]|uniref:Cytochrome P450 n=1 Tax=Elysia chlorotica TaxID=188477 RepID=A0A433TD81_ELYCH|nr:hypothetical protein EGW08_012696 [Elysia chlorotica]